MIQVGSTRRIVSDFIINLLSPSIKIDLQKREAKDPEELIPQVNPVAVLVPVNAERENLRVEAKLQPAKGRHCVTRGNATVSDSDGRFQRRAQTQPYRCFHKITPGKSPG